jgi:uncharacterized protein
MRFLLLFAFLLVPGMPGKAFAERNCDQSPVARAICDDADLKALNDELARLLAELVIQTNEAKYLSEQIAWMKERDKTCTQAPVNTCLAKLYMTRLAAVRDQLAEAKNKPLHRQQLEEESGLQRLINLEITTGRFECDEDILSRGFDECTLNAYLNLTVSHAKPFTASGTCTLSWLYKTELVSLERTGTKTNFVTIYGFGPTHIEPQRFRFDPAGLAVGKATQVRMTGFDCEVTAIH